MRKMIFVGRIMSSPDDDGNVEPFLGSAGQIVAELFRIEVDTTHSSLCLDDGEHLAFGDHVINADEYQFEVARCR